LSADVIERARELALTILAGYEAPGPADVELAIAGALAATERISPGAAVDATRLRREIEELVTIFVPGETVLEDNTNHVPWLAEERASIEWSFWERYRRFLVDRQLPPQAARRLGEITDDVLGRLESPRRQGAWDRRGMVVGQVQSGKTANYVGLICKAADAGYRVIVVLTGMHDSLRSQTQRRIDEGFLGFDSRTTLAFSDGERKGRIGAGALVANAHLLPAFSYTSSLPNGDFNRNRASSVAAQVGSDPVVLVVKKNKTILENLIAWTTAHAIRDPRTGRPVVPDQPLLVIDDEADNASVNTKEVERETDGSGEVLRETDPTTINRLIRQLLNTFEKSAYVGYTATPFANIFIWEDEPHEAYGEDLFPRSFIVRLPTPSNYVGPAKVFGVAPAGSLEDVDPPALPIIRPVDDYGNFVPDKHKKDLEVGPLPRSLRQALGAFVLTCAARRARGQVSVHNSMLIHVTRFVDVQAQVVEAVREELEGMRRRIRLGEGASDDTLVTRLKMLWESDFEPTTDSFAEDERGRKLVWDEVEPHLLEAVSRIEARQINGTSADALAYTEHPDGLSVIAVGGDKLSRGLTLEGLSVSYYLRASRMYDTLMQMGRWFGYRPGYLDLCRLYTTEELEGWYRDITVANEELLEEFDAMAAAGGTPHQYGLRVRKHPAGLLITAQAKMRNGKEMKLDYSGSGVPTNAFSLNPEDHHANLRLTDGFIRDLDRDGLRRPDPGPRGAHMFGRVPGPAVARFFEGFRTSPRARRANAQILARYISASVAHGELTDWTVALLNNRSGRRAGPIAGLEVGLFERTPKKDRREELMVTDAYSIGQILSPPDEWLDLDETELEAAREDTRQRFEAGEIRTRNGRPPEIDGIGARHARPRARGLMLLYPLDPEVPRGEGLRLDLEEPLIGFYLSFPRGTTSVKYQVNNVYWEQDLGQEE
jgi:Z1 domain